MPKTRKPVAIWNCQKKRRWETRDEADKTAQHIWEESQDELRPYKCHLCEGWHLTNVHYG